MVFNIYYLIDPLFPEDIRYIGVTSKNIETRLLEHLKEARYRPKKRSHKLFWIRQIIKENRIPEIILLEVLYDIDKEKAYKVENDYIEKYKKLGHNLVNLNRPGGLNFEKHTEETKLKLSNASLKQWEDMSENEREDRYLRFTKLLKGNKFAEGKGASRAGDKHPRYKGKIVQLSKELKIIKIWISMYELKEAGYKINSIWNAANGVTKSSQGFYWKYEEKEAI